MQALLEKVSVSRVTKTQMLAGISVCSIIESESRVCRSSRPNSPGQTAPSSMMRCCASSSLGRGATSAQAQISTPKIRARTRAAVHLSRLKKIRKKFEKNQGYGRHAGGMEPDRATWRLFQPVQRERCERHLKPNGCSDDNGFYPAPVHFRVPTPCADATE
jgi:hypothetical protein